MPLGEMLYLALVIAAFLAFSFNLAAVTWIESKYRASREGRG
jgi:hypothetical protein